MMIDALPTGARVCGVLFALLVAQSANSRGLVRPDPVRTASGLVEGTPSDTGTVYKGIPFAAPPEGSLRWRSPEPPPPWPGIRRADKFGPPCAQDALRGRTEISSTSREDCLYLNIWTPGRHTGAKLPVMVWIHGGGFQNGMGSSPTYDGAALAARGVIVVTINYRLGVFGFLAHPELSTESPNGLSGNFGLQDQIAALRWVSANVGGFGGDASSVTIFGQSAGGASVVDLLSSKQAEGLFARAIVQSGASHTGMTPTPLQQAQRQGLAFAGEQTIAQLRMLDTAHILQQARVSGVRFGPVADGYLITHDPMTSGADPRRPFPPLLIGSNSREGLVVLPEEKLEAAIMSGFGRNGAKAALAYKINQGTATDRLLGTAAEQFATDSTFRCGNVAFAQTSVKAGGRTWQYQFEHFVPGKESQGAAHSFEVPYVFGNLSSTGFSSAEYGAEDRRLADLMMDYWTNFAKRGDPNGTGLPKWPRYTTADKSYLRLSTAFRRQGRVDADLRGEICRLFPTVATSEE